MNINHSIGEDGIVFHRCVAIDMRGYSESDKPRGVHNYSMDRLTGDLKELIPALGAQNV